MAVGAGDGTTMTVPPLVVGETVGVGEAVGVAVGVGEAVGVAVGEAEAVGVAVGEAEAVGVALAVAVAVGAGVGTVMITDVEFDTKPCDFVVVPVPSETAKTHGIGELGDAPFEGLAPLDVIV